MMQHNNSDRPNRTDQHDPPPVYVRTLGVFEVLVHGIQAAWKSGNAGAKQLQRGFGYLVLRRGRPVRDDELTRVAGGYSDIRGDRRHVIASLLRMLKQWGLSTALKRQRSTITLQRNPVWRTDTDQLDELFTGAQALVDMGQPGHAIQLLEAAENLCNGDYLPIFAPGFDPALASENAHWKNVQKQTLQLLARLYTKMPGVQSHLLAARVASAAIRFDPANPDAYWFAAEAERHSGNEEAARYYERIALDLMRQSRPDP